MTMADFYTPAYLEDEDARIGFLNKFQFWFLIHIVPILTARIRREDRKETADRFRAEYFYGRCNDNKTCIWSGGRCNSSLSDSWLAKSCGITWIAVHGKDSICVVTKAGDLDVSRVHGLLIYSLEDEVFRNFRRAVISEVEDLADPSSKLRKKLNKKLKRLKSMKKPFGVVSVVPLSDKVHKATYRQYEETKITKFYLEGLEKEETLSDDDSDFDENDEDAGLKYLVKLSIRNQRAAAKNNDPGYDEDESKTIKVIQDKMKSDEKKRGKATINGTAQKSGDKCDEKKAIKFLKKEMMKSAEDFTLKETIKTAIAAFRHLFNKEFKANEIEVSVMDPDYFVSVGVLFKDIYVNHLETIEIKKYLSDISQQERWGLSDHRLKRMRKPFQRLFEDSRHSIEA